MGVYSDAEKKAWQAKAGFKTTSDVMAAEKEARESGGEPQARVVTGSELEALLGRAMGSSAGGDVQQQMLEQLRQMNDKLDNMGRIG